MTDIDDVTEALLRRIEASIDLDDAYAELGRRLTRQHHRGVARWSIAAAVALAVIGVAVMLRVGGDEGPSGTVGAVVVDGAVAPRGTGVPSNVPYLMLDPSTWTLAAFMTHGRSADPASDGLATAPVPVAVYTSSSEEGPVVAIERVDTPPATVGTDPPAAGEPFVAGDWRGTVRRVGAADSPVRSAVVQGPDLADGWLAVTARQVDEQTFVDLVAGIQRAGDSWRLADEGGMTLVSDGAVRPNADGWTAEWQGPGGEVQVNSYRETGAPRFIERLAASPTMTRIDVSGRPGAVFESGGYTVFSWLATPVDVVEIRVEGEGPEAVEQAAALARSSRLATEAELRALLPPSSDVPSASTEIDPGGEAVPAAVGVDAEPPPFDVPAGFDRGVRPQVVRTPDGTAVLYQFAVSSDSATGSVGSSISVSIIRPRGSGAADESISDFARRVVAADAQVEEVQIGGRQGAALAARSLDGRPFGAPDRVGRVYVFEVGGLAFEVSVDNVDTDVLGAVIESVDEGRVLAVYAELADS